MTYYGLHNDTYITGRELGKGGEGTVYDIQHHSGMVLKKYNEPLTSSKLDKLRLMASMSGPAIEAYAAWPKDIVRDNTGAFCGFVMKKLAGYVPLHMVFSPMDRKKMFPDKGYNFLVHVARNLATAFYKLHEAGLVVGDVNEGNILINASGMVAFIDCDSFQVKGEKGYYFCEVGIPRYTPPELLKKGSFEDVIRTVNTDSFSLAILLFQLLFLGRHPFAGKHKLAADIDEETAIKKKEFAYSLDNPKKKLSPPDNSFSITNLPGDVVSLFHKAFEQDDRPVPHDWILALDKLSLEMVTCSISGLHTYPSKLEECPWCYYTRSKGILYFLDDSYLHASVLPGDMESFVNGFDLSKLELHKWRGSNTHTGIAPTVIDQRFYSYSRLRKSVSIAFAASGIALLFFSPLSACILLVFALLAYRYSPWTKQLQAELKRRAGIHTQLLKKQHALITEYDSPADINNYFRTLDLLVKLVSDFKKMPSEFERRKKLMEEHIYNEQLGWYLNSFDIATHTIPSFGSTKKNALYNSGIRTAADINKLQATKVPGIGPKNLQVLYSWQRQMSSGFVYIPDNYKITAGLQKVNGDMAAIRSSIEATIRKEYQALTHLRLNISNRAVMLEKQINEISRMARQAEADMLAFKKLAA